MRMALDRVRTKDADMPKGLSADDRIAVRNIAMRIDHLTIGLLLGRGQKVRVCQKS